MRDDKLSDEPKENIVHFNPWRDFNGALDLGITTGWALQAADGLITSGTVSFRSSRYDGGGMRYLRFRAWLERLAADAGPIAAIWFEEVRRHAGTDAAHMSMAV